MLIYHADALMKMMIVIITYDDDDNINIGNVNVCTVLYEPVVSEEEIRTKQTSKKTKQNNNRNKISSAFVKSIL